MVRSQAANARIRNGHSHVFILDADALGYDDLGEEDIVGEEDGAGGSKRKGSFAVVLSPRHFRLFFSHAVCMLTPIRQRH
jgi:hypothetical protein